MAAIVINPADVRLVRGGDEHQLTAPAAVVITAGQYIRPDANGQWILGDATVPANVGDGYIASRSAAIGESLTGLKGPCVVAVGAALAALAYGDIVYLGAVAGGLDDAAQAVNVPVGRVIPGWARTTADKILRLVLD